MKTEFTIEKIRQFVEKGYTSVSARYVKAILQHYDSLKEETESHSSLTPEKLGVMFDAKAIAWDEVSPGSKVMESQEFIEIAQELTSQTRQPETEINLPSDEAVREYIRAIVKWGDKYPKGKIYSISSKEGMQMIRELDELVDRANYFIVTNPVKAKQSELPEDKQRNELLDLAYNPEIPEDRLREGPKSRKERVDEARLWLSNMGYGTGTNMTFDIVGILLDQYLTERKESKK